jgi:hypothetical protein
LAARVAAAAEVTSDAGARDRLPALRCSGVALAGVIE